MRRLSRVLISSLTYLIAALAPAQAGDPAVRTDTPSGLPVPRFVSLKHAKTYCRQGPSFEHPIAFTYLRKGLPVKIVAETTDHWRKIKDYDGAECWAHQTTLRAVDHVIVREDLEIRARPETSAPARARLRAGVIAEVERAAGEWRLIAVEDVSGWARESALWGAQDD